MARDIPLLLLINRTIADDLPAHAASISDDVLRGKTTYRAEWAKVSRAPRVLVQTEQQAARNFWYVAGIASARALAVAYATHLKSQHAAPRTANTIEEKMQKAIDFASAASVALYNHGDMEGSMRIIQYTCLARADSDEGRAYRAKLLAKSQAAALARA